MERGVRVRGKSREGRTRGPRPPRCGERGARRPPGGQPGNVWQHGAMINPGPRNSQTTKTQRHRRPRTPPPRPPGPGCPRAARGGTAVRCGAARPELRGAAAAVAPGGSRAALCSSEAPIEERCPECSHTAGTPRRVPPVPPSPGSVRETFPFSSFSPPPAVQDKFPEPALSSGPGFEL